MMKPLLQWPVLPHEWIFGLFLVVTWLRLALVAGPLSPDAILYLVLILTSAGLVHWCGKQKTTLRWHLRLWFYPVAMNLVFFTTKTTIPKISPHKMDGFLQSVDAALVGRSLSLRLGAFTTPWLTETLSFCYLLFFPYLLFSMVYYAARGVSGFKELLVGLFTIYGLGFFGYSWVPAAGPYLAIPGDFAVPLEGWWLTNLNARIVARGSNGVDVFPSLHCAISSYLLLFDWRRTPWRFKLYLLPCVGLWISTIYLRYHYFIDLLCGFALSALALWLVNRWSQSQSGDLQPAANSSHDLHPSF